MTEGPLLGTYARLPVTFTRGEGVWLYDDAGRRYLDMLAGIAVCALGHAHPALTKALQGQAERLLHVSNFFTTPEGVRAAEMLTAKLGGGQVFFCNSGAEANEAAIKLVRKHGWRRGEPERTEIVALEGSFHGRTLGALAATMQPAKWEGFAPMPAGFVGVAANDIDALKQAISERTAAVFLESIQGEAGVRPLTPEFAQTARQLTSEHGALLVCDEVQTGVGRTGRWWGFEHLDILPDVVTLAKALGGGVPVGAMWADDHCATGLGPGDHATTFGGQPLAATAVCTVLETIEKESLVGHAREVGALLRRELEPLGTEVRGRGLLLALELDTPTAADVVRAGLERGLVVNAVTPTTIRLVPPLVLTVDEAMEGVERLKAAVAEAAS